MQFSIKRHGALCSLTKAEIYLKRVFFNFSQTKIMAFKAVVASCGNQASCSMRLQRKQSRCSLSFLFLLRLVFYFICCRSLQRAALMISVKGEFPFFDTWTLFIGINTLIYSPRQFWCSLESFGRYLDPSDIFVSI